MAQLVEQLLLTSEVCGSNPVIGKVQIEHLLSTVLKRRKIQKKEAGYGPFKKDILKFPKQLGTMFQFQNKIRLKLIFFVS